MSLSIRVERKVEANYIYRVTKHQSERKANSQDWSDMAAEYLGPKCSSECQGYCPYERPLVFSSLLFFLLAYIP